MNDQLKAYTNEKLAAYIIPVKCLARFTPQEKS